MILHVLHKSLTNIDNTNLFVTFVEIVFIKQTNIKSWLVLSTAFEQKNIIRNVYLRAVICSCIALSIVRNVIFIYIYIYFYIHVYTYIHDISYTVYYIDIYYVRFTYILTRLMWKRLFVYQHRRPRRSISENRNTHHAQTTSFHGEEGRVCKGQKRYRRKTALLVCH